MQSVANKTHRNDQLRAPFLGILETGWSTFALVIAIRYFDANETVKAWITGAGPMGFLLAPLSLYLGAVFKLCAHQACTLLFTATAILLGMAASVDSLGGYCLTIVLSQICAVQCTPFMLKIFADNYAPSERGRRMSRPFMLTATCAIAFSLVGGALLDRSLNHYPILFATMALSGLVLAYLSQRFESQKITQKHTGNPWQNLSLIWQDRFFGYLLGAWMLLGLGNLITLPIRIEYLADPKYGINASNTTISILMLVIPACTRIASTPLWSRLFDRVSLITNRNILNFFFLVSIAGFFYSKNVLVIGCSMAAFGIAIAGGKILWSLWVTKIAPVEKSAAYMSIHMALTGFRGTLAPFIGYWILSQFHAQAVALTGGILIILACIAFECMRQHPRILNQN
jgi:hypothetical protein